MLLAKRVYWERETNSDRQTYERGGQTDPPHMKTIHDCACQVSLPSVAAQIIALMDDIQKNVSGLM